MERSVDRESGKHLHHQWEMKRDKMAIRNPAWNEYVQNVAAKAAEALGIKPDAGAVKAELASIRLWTAGACLAPYKEYVNWPRPGFNLSLT